MLYGAPLQKQRCNSGYLFVTYDRMISVGKTRLDNEKKIFLLCFNGKTGSFHIATRLKTKRRRKNITRETGLVGGDEERDRE